MKIDSLFLFLCLIGNTLAMQKNKSRFKMEGLKLLLDDSIKTKIESPEIQDELAKSKDEAIAHGNRSADNILKYSAETRAALEQAAKTYADFFSLRLLMGDRLDEHA